LKRPTTLSAWSLQFLFGDVLPNHLPLLIGELHPHV
jgi:hypothetical protein